MRRASGIRSTGSAISQITLWRCWSEATGIVDRRHRETGWSGNRISSEPNQHAANENLRLQNLWDGIEIFAGILTGAEGNWK